MTKRCKLKSKLKTWLTAATALVIALVTFTGECKDVQAAEAREYLDEYISGFSNLNNGSVSYFIDSDGRYKICKNDNSEYKILQITDFHLTGYDENGGWGNDRNLNTCDRQAILAVYRIIEKTRPDLIVMSGDIIYGGDFNTVSGNKRALDALIRMMNRIDVPWIYLLGNHDHHFIDGFMGENCREYFFNKLRQANSLLLYDRYEPFYPSDSGDFCGAPEYMYGSYKLYNHDGSFNSVIIGLDSGSNDIGDQDYDYIYDAQCDWYENEIKSIATENGLAPSELNSYLYYHIPLNSIEDACRDGSGSSYNYGEIRDWRCCSRHSDPIWDRILELGSTRAMSYGHNHANDLWFTYNGIDCIYGKSIEYSVYNWDESFPGLNGAQRGGSEIHIRQDGSHYITENSLNDFNKNSFVLEDNGVWRWEDENNSVNTAYTGSGWNGYEQEYMKDGTLVWNGASGEYAIPVYSDADYSVAVKDGSTSDGANVEIEKTVESARKEVYFFEKVSDGIYVIKTLSSGQNFALTAEGTDDNSNVTQSDYTGSDLQKWKIVKNADGSVSFLLVADTSKALDIAGSLPVSEGRNVHVYSFDITDPDTAGLDVKSAYYWKYENGDYYLYDVDGNRMTDWQRMGKYWYYMDNDGAMATGWRYVNHVWYYLGDDGAMATGWRYIDNNWYYFDENGSMAIGWRLIDGNWYFMSGSGAMTVGWQYINDTWYYLTSYGAMAHNEYYDGYWLNADGSWTYPYKASWKLTDGRWWFGDDTGWYAKDQIERIDGTAYNFDTEGYLE
ncbi:MAG: metallophosphoesterase [Lachnospira sp.]|nr:metallophosphoesterase [Lachnospira sp.]